MMSAIPFKTGRVGSTVIFGALILLFLQPRTLAQSSQALTLDDQPLRYSLPDGETTLIIRVPNASLLDRFTFINEETVRGALQIAVANSPLSPADPSWNRVSGDIAFAHKRYFNLSMVGVDAKYVKLSFRVIKEDRLAGFGR
jgi:hypothetical protein